MPAVPTTVALVRHGQIAANVEHVWHGSIDSPLNELGRRQAACVARYVGEAFGAAKALYSSPLERTRHTAEAIAATLGLPVQIEADVREYDLGSFEGRTYPDLNADGFFERVGQDPDFAPHGGESPRKVATRVAGALQRIAAAHPGAQVVVVSHGAALNLGLGYLLAGTLTDWSRIMANGAVTELAFDPAPRVVRFNHTAHLDGL